MTGYLSDNIGRRVPPHPNMAAPVAASGATLTDAATGADHTQAVVGGATYAFTCRPAPYASGTMTDTTFIFGILTVATAANIEWVCTPAQTVILQIPNTVSSLHYMSLGSGGSGFLRRLA